MEHPQEDLEGLIEQYLPIVDLLIYRAEYGKLRFMVLKLQNSMNNIKRNKKSEIFSQNEVDMRKRKIREIRVIRIIRDSDNRVLEL